MQQRAVEFSGQLVPFDSLGLPEPKLVEVTERNVEMWHA